MPLVSGVNIAGLALMGQIAKGRSLRRNTPTDLDAKIERGVTQSATLC
jgi:hypothetical protein